MPETLFFFNAVNDMYDVPAELDAFPVAPALTPAPRNCPRCPAMLVPFLYEGTPAGAPVVG